MRGLMQDWPMRVHRLSTMPRCITRARGSSAAPSKAASIAPTMREIRARALKLAGALDPARHQARRPGRDPGLEHASPSSNAWYGIAGMGAVYHTLNPRLFPDQIAWIANHGGARS